MAVLGAVGIILVTMVCIRIYLAVRRHKNQIQVLQVQQVAQADEVANFSSLAKSAVGIFYVYLVFLVCYLPYLIVLASFETIGSRIIFKKNTPFYNYSCLSEFIFEPSNLFCWKMRQIRHAVMNILRNMSWLRNCSSIETIGSAGHTITWCNVVVALHTVLIRDVAGKRNRSI